MNTTTEERAYAVVNCYGNEACRYCFAEMARAVAARYTKSDPMMRAWKPYRVVEIAADAPVLAARNGGIQA